MLQAARAGRGPAGAACSIAAAGSVCWRSSLLAVHLLTPQSWPFAGRGASPPGTSPARSRTPSRPLIPFPSLARVSAVARRSRLGPLRASLATGARDLRDRRGLGVGPALGRRRAPTALGAGRRPAGRCVVGWPRLCYPCGLDPRLLLLSRRSAITSAAGWSSTSGRARRGARVAYAGTNLPYYLMGAGLRNEVRYVNVDAHRGWLLHDYHRDGAGRRRPADLAAPPARLGPDPSRLRRLARQPPGRGIQLLVVARANPDEGPHNVADARGLPDRAALGRRPPRVLRAALRRGRERPGCSGSTGSPCRRTRAVGSSRSIRGLEKNPEFARIGSARPH